MKKSMIYSLAIFLVACSPEQTSDANTSELVKKPVMTETVIVAVETVKPTSFEHHFSVDGVVEPKKEAYVTAEGQGGRVKGILVSEGQYVNAGTVLARLNGSIAESQMKQAESNFELSKTIFERTERLWLQNKIGSEIQYMEARSRFVAAESGMQAAKAQLDMTIIKAPISGIVDKVNLKIGEMATAMQPFAHIVNMSSLSVVADVSERYSKSLKKGDHVEVNFPDLDVTNGSSIRRIGNVINPQNRSFEIEVGISTTIQGLKPNALAKLKVSDFETKTALVVPSNAIQQDAEGDFVFTAKKSGKALLANKVYVKVSRTNDQNQSMIASGLVEGDVVVTKGYNLLTKGSEIRLSK
jgi:membrane fusion protein (multidrug efflux system)